MLSLERLIEMEMQRAQPQGTRADGAAYYGPGRADAPRPPQAPSRQHLPGGALEPGVIGERERQVELGELAKRMRWLFGV